MQQSGAEGGGCGGGGQSGGLAGLSPYILRPAGAAGLPSVPKCRPPHPHSGVTLRDPALLPQAAWATPRRWRAWYATWP